MISRLNNNSPFRPIEDSSKEQEVNSTQVGSDKQALITEYGIPSLDAKNAEGSSTLVAEGKNIMNMRAGLQQKQLNEELSNRQPQPITMMDYELNPVVTYSVNGGNMPIVKSEAQSKENDDAPESFQKEPANVEIPN